MADGAYTYYSKNYPFNVVPQVKAPVPSGPLPNLACPPDFTSQFIIFEYNKLSVIKGYESKGGIDLKEFFIPAENFLTYEFTLKYNPDFTKYVTLNYANVGDENGNVKFLGIMPMYHNSEIEDQDNWYINFRWGDDPIWTEYGTYNDNVLTPDSAEDESTWRHLGRILLFDTSKEKLIKPLLLQNRTGSDIIMRIIIAY